MNTLPLAVCGRRGLKCICRCTGRGGDGRTGPSRSTWCCFPGYLFCRFGVRDKLRVMTSAAVRGIVRNGREPIPVDDAEIESIRTLIASGRPIDMCPFLRVGEHVRISHGPFESVRGVIVRTGDNWRVIVSVEALGCSVSVEVDADQLLPDRKPPATIHTERTAHGHLQA